MAYSDWGGYACRNGRRVPENEDATLGDEMYHVILGNGQTRLCGYKSSPVLLIDGKEQNLDPFTVVSDFPTKGGGKIDGYRFGWKQQEYPEKIDLWLIEPDGTRWTGFSGYAMGAGWWD